MVCAKRGLLFILFLLLVSNVYSINLNITLDSTKVGPGSVFDGTFSMNLTEALPLQTEVNFHSDTNIHTYSLKEILEIANLLDDVDLIDESYGATGSGTSVSVAGNGISSGWDFRGPVSIPNRPGDVIVNELIFKIKAGTIPVNGLKIALGDDLIYRYRGAETTWAELDESHVTGSSAIKFSPNNVYCQNITVPPSGKYKLKAVVKKHSELVNLNFSLSNNPLAFPTCNEDQPCCSVLNSVITSTFAEKSCDIVKNIPEETIQYLCIFPSEFVDEDTFSVRANNAGVLRGSVSEAIPAWNFHIYGDYRLYVETLGANALTPPIIINPEILNNYMLGLGSCDDNCLVIPLNVSTENNAPMTFRDLSLEYSVNGATVEENEFQEIELLPETVNYDGRINIELSSLEDVVSPTTLDINYTLFVSVNNENSN